MKQTLAVSLVDSLRRRIVDGTIPSGEKLPSESALIAEFGVSRTVVREAISRLQAEGLVYTRRGSGSFALTPPSVDEESPGGMRRPRTLEERRALLAFRAGVESEAAALAAANATPGMISALDDALAAFDAAGNHPATAVSCDFAFHRAVAEASGNFYFVDALLSLGPAMIAMPPQRLEPADDGCGQSERLHRVAVEHTAVRNAIAAGDPLTAAAAMRLHLANSRARLDGELPS
jgi:GntR family transcriptional repressor for pyruvate dehydrogenase complex